MEKQRSKKDTQKASSKIRDINSTLLVIILNENGLKTPNERKRLAEWIKKYDPTICCLRETYFRFRHKEVVNKRMKITYTIQAVIKRDLDWLY